MFIISCVNDLHYTVICNPCEKYPETYTVRTCTDNMNRCLYQSETRFVSHVHIVHTQICNMGIRNKKD